MAYAWRADLGGWYRASDAATAWRADLGGWYRELGAGGGGQTVAIGQAAEADLSQPLTTALAIGQASEDDEAQPLSYTAPGAIGQATQTDTAQPLAAHQSRLLGPAAESSAAQPLAYIAGSAIGLALEIDTAGAFAAHQSRAIGQAVESDAAQAITLGAAGGGTGATAQEVVDLLMDGTYVEPGLTVRAWMRITLAALSGRTSGIGTGTEQYLSVDGTRARITATFDSADNRASVTLDGS